MALTIYTRHIMAGFFLRAYARRAYGPRVEPCDRTSLQNNMGVPMREAHTARAGLLPCGNTGLYGET